MIFQMILLISVTAQCQSYIDKKLINAEIDVTPSASMPRPQINLGKIQIIDGCKVNCI